MILKKSYNIILNILKEINFGYYRLKNKLFISKNKKIEK